MINPRTNQPVPEGFVLCCSCFKKYDPDCMFCRGKSVVDLNYFSGKSGKRVLCPLCKGEFEKNKFCTHCNGWGYVMESSKDAKCIHKWEHVKNLGKCLNLYKCYACGSSKTVDSSD